MLRTHQDSQGLLAPVLGLCASGGMFLQCTHADDVMPYLHLSGGSCGTCCWSLHAPAHSGD